MCHKLPGQQQPAEKHEQLASYRREDLALTKPGKELRKDEMMATNITPNKC